MADQLEEFGLRALRQADNLGSLRGGDQRFLALKTFARRDAKRYEAENLARTYVVYRRADDGIVAYVTLLCSEVVTERDAPLVEADGLRFPYDTYPAIKIARLMVDERYRGGGRGIGRQLVNFAQGLAGEVVSAAVGCRFVVVDAKRDSVGFYERCGFTAVDTVANRARSEPVMYLDLHKAR